MLQLHDISLFLGERPILKHCSASFSSHKTGIVGDNGSGKSTLLHLLAGDIQPSSGQVFRSGEIGVLQQDFSPFLHQTIGEFLGIQALYSAWMRVLKEESTLDDLDTLDGQWDFLADYTRIFTLLGMPDTSPDIPMNILSGGMLMRVGLARLLLGTYAYVFLDEPTNHLDQEGRKAVLEFIDAFNGGLLIASHDRELLEHMDIIVEIRDAKLCTYGGNFSFYKQQKEAEWLAEERKVTTQENTLHRVKKSLQRTAEKQQKRAVLGKRKSTEGGIPKILLGARKERNEKTSGSLHRLKESRMNTLQSDLDTARLSVQKRPQITIVLPEAQNIKNKIAVDAKNITLSRGGNLVLSNLTFQIQQGERISVSGVNGTGKSTLLQVLSGQLAPERGKFRGIIENPTTVGYLDQHATILKPNDTVYSAFSAFHPNTPESKKRIILAEFLFFTEFLERKVSSLSGGEKNRLALACLLSSEPAKSILLLDEPTNHMDMKSVETIEAALLQYKGTLLIVSHDRTFMQNIGCEREIAL